MSFRHSFLKNNIGSLALSLALIASLGLNVYLAVKLKQRLMPPPPGGIRANTTIKTPLQLQDKAGKPVAFSFGDDSRPTVLYVFSPNCGWCKRNEPNIKALFSAAGTRFRFVGLSTDPKSLPEYVAAGHIPFPVYLANEKVRKDLNLSGTPDTAVIARDGKVQKAWAGAYLAQNLTDIEKYFDTKLPGLAQVAANVEKKKEVDAKK